MPTHEIYTTVPVIATDDIKKSLTYYCNILGFTPDFEYGDPPVYAGVKAGDAEIYFAHSPDSARVLKDAAIHLDVFIWVENADNWYHLHVKNGAEIVDSIADRPWGARQYVVKDLNGYHLKFAQPV